MKWSHCTFILISVVVFSLSLGSDCEFQGGSDDNSSSASAVWEARTPVEVARPIGSTDYPDLAAGSGLVGLTWSDGRDDPDCLWSNTELDCDTEIYFLPLSPDGDSLGPNLRVSHAVNLSTSPSLVFTGSEWGVAWQDGRDGNGEIYFSRLSLAGDSGYGELRVTTAEASSAAPSLAWSGTEYGVSFHDYRDGGGSAHIFFSRISAAGSEIGDEGGMLNTLGGNAISPDVVWTGTEFAVAWKENLLTGLTGPEVFLSRVSPSGSLVTPEVRLTFSGDYKETPSLAWTGSEIGMAWAGMADDGDGVCDVSSGTHDCDSDIYFIRLAPDGATIGAPIRVTKNPSQSWAPSLIYNGKVFGLAWIDDRDGDFDVYFTRLDLKGRKLMKDLSVSVDSTKSRGVSLIWLGGGSYGAAWCDGEDSPIYCKRILYSRIIKVTD